MRRFIGPASFLVATAFAGSGSAAIPIASPATAALGSGAESAGASSASSAACTAPAWSAPAVYVGGNTVSFGANQYVADYWTENDEPDTHSGPPGSGQPWGSPTSCAAPSCVPQCAGMQCGADGCGGTCGTCGASETCNGSNQCIAVCTPACGGRQCGGDSCGGSCGACGATETCTADGLCKTTAPATTSKPPLAVSLDPQLESEWCWAASAEMIMGYLGTSVSQCEQANYRFGRTDCCANAVSAENIYECNQPGWPDWSHWGFTFSETPVGSAISFAQLQAELAANRPVGFAWAWTSGGGHYMVATGVQIDQDGVQYVTINDPWAPDVGEQVTLTYEDWVSGPAGTDATATVSYTHMADDYGISARN